MLVVMLAVSAVVVPRPATAAPTVDEFAISFGDVVSDGVPSPGAGSIEIVEPVDSYFFDVSNSVDAVFDVLSRSAGAFRWTLTSSAGATILDHALYTDRRLLLTESGTYTLSVSGAIVAADPDGDTLEIAASGLPTGIAVDGHTLTGTIAAGAAGASPYAGASVALGGRLIDGTAFAGSDEIWAHTGHAGQGGA
jgi:hypothetical protein